MPAYSPPVLDRRVTLRNPEDRPPVLLDQYGRPLDGGPQWGVDVWSNKLDLDPYTEVEEGVLIRGNTTVWTVYHRGGIGPNTIVVDDRGVEYTQRGAPIERGGPDEGMLQRYLELHCELQSAAVSE